VHNNPLEAYKTIEKKTMSGRETEARVLTQAALKLINCRDNWSGKDRDEKLDDALKYTQRIWSIFQGELSNEDNPLPRQLRINLLRLSSFIDKRIFETMSYPSPEKLTAVININKNIAAGLRGSPSD
jgi:flagellar biosynthesis activator protein FlaF